MSAVASGIRLRTTWLFSPAAHYESAVTQVSDCEQGGCFQLLRIRNPLRLKIYDCEQGSYCICGASSEFRGFRDVAANNGMILFIQVFMSKLSHK